MSGNGLPRTKADFIAMHGEKAYENLVTPLEKYGSESTAESATVSAHLQIQHAKKICSIIKK